MVRLGLKGKKVTREGGGGGGGVSCSLQLRNDLGLPSAAKRPNVVRKRGGGGGGVVFHILVDAAAYCMLSSISQVLHPTDCRYISHVIYMASSDGSLL